MPGVLLVAKAPVPGLAKTRLAAELGPETAADLAAAALLDTLDAAEAWAPRSRRLVALVGDLTAARRGDEVRTRLSRWCVVPQRGATFAQRLQRAHRDAANVWGRSEAVVQIGMDTPQLTAGDLDILATAVTDSPRGGFRSDARARNGWRLVGARDQARGVRRRAQHRGDVDPGYLSTDGGDVARGRR